MRRQVFGICVVIKPWQDNGRNSVIIEPSAVKYGVGFVDENMTTSNKSLLLILLLLLTQVACEEEHRRPANIYIPDGYIGWLRIEYDVPNTPKLKRDFFGPWEYQRFPPSGLLQTSSELNDGAASANYFYYSGNEEKPLSHDMINGGIISFCVVKPDGSRWDRHFITYFVGPKEDYLKHEHELEQFKKGECRYVISGFEDLPKVGNLSVNAPAM